MDTAPASASCSQPPSSQPRSALSPLPSPSDRTTDGLVRGRLLLVEDDLTTRKALQILLARHGWQVEPAPTLADALRQLAAAPPAAVVLDLMLPDGSGVSVMEYLKSARLASRVVVTTGAGDQRYLAGALSFRPHALLQKPIRFAELVAALGSPE